MHHSESEASRSLLIQPGVTCSFLNRTQMSKNPAAAARPNVWLRGASLNQGQRVKTPPFKLLNSVLSTKTDFLSHITIFWIFFFPIKKNRDDLNLILHPTTRGWADHFFTNKVPDWLIGWCTGPGLLWHRVLGIGLVFKVSSRYFENVFSCVLRAGVSRGQLIHHTAARSGSNWHLVLNLVTVALTEKRTGKDQDIFYKSDLIFNK